MTYDPTKEPSVQACGLSRKLRRRGILPNLDAMKFPPTTPQQGTPDGDTGAENTPANRLKGESLHQIPDMPPGFGNAGSLADAVATAPKTILDQTVDELVAETAAELGMSAARTVNGDTPPLTVETIREIRRQLEAATQVSVPTPAPPPPPADPPAPGDSVIWTFNHLDKIDALITEGEAPTVDQQPVYDVVTGETKEPASESQEHTQN